MDSRLRPEGSTLGVRGNDEIDLFSASLTQGLVPLVMPAFAGMTVVSSFIGSEQ
jgi:hypothetical protein